MIECGSEGLLSKHKCWDSRELVNRITIGKSIHIVIILDFIIFYGDLHLFGGSLRGTTYFRRPSTYNVWGSKHYILIRVLFFFLPENDPDLEGIL